MKHLCFFLFLGTLISCSSTPTASFSLKKAALLKLTDTPALGKTSSGQDLLLGGFSGLALKSVSDNEIIFWTHTDRGPIAYNPGIDKPFLLPEFSPQIIELKANLTANTLDVIKTIKLKKKDGKPLSGIPNQRTGENPMDSFGFMISLDPFGMDVEGLVPDESGGFWIAEEYGPSLVLFDAEGKLVRRMLPFNELPKLYSERKANRGFEGIAKENSRLFGFLQSPIPGEDFTRIVEVDLDSMKTTHEYFYMIDKDKDRLGDAVFIGKNKFLVIEQNGKKGNDGRKVIYKITLNQSDELVKKELVVDLQDTEFKHKDKVEGLALIDKNRLAIVNDNDFSLAEKWDRTNGTISLNDEKSEMLILEFSEDLTQ